MASVPAGAKNAVAGDNHGGLWLSLFAHGLVHLVDGKITEHVSWQRLGGGPGPAACPTRTVASGRGC